MGGGREEGRRKNGRGRKGVSKDWWREGGRSGWSDVRKGRSHGGKKKEEGRIWEGKKRGKEGPWAIRILKEGIEEEEMKGERKEE